MGRASEKRIARVKSLILRTLSELIRDELTDPRLGNLSLCDARISPDLAYADITVAVIGEVKQAEECVTALNSAAGLLWHRLRAETDLRTVPRLRFHQDVGSRYSSQSYESTRSYAYTTYDICFMQHRGNTRRYGNAFDGWIQH